MNELSKVESYCQLTATSLKFKREVNEKEWQEVFNSLSLLDKCVHFWIGDCLAYKKQEWGMYKDLAERVGFVEGTLKNDRIVSESVEPARRRADLSFGHHAEVAKLEPKQQDKMLEKASREKMTVKDLRNEIKRSTHEYKEVKLPEGKFNIIYADPPWKYDKDESYFGQTVEAHYKPMEAEEIYQLPINKITADDCVLYLWCTAPKLNIGLKVIESWGFDYKTCLIWDKVKHNMGHYSSVRHELLLIGGKGASAPSNKSYANQTDSVYVEDRTEHSKKPEYYYDMIEKMHPTKTKRIELFARNKRKCWSQWGNEV